MSKLRVGVIGCGDISAIYLKNFKERFQTLEVTACAAKTLAHAQARADEYGIAKACTVEEILADPNIDIVLNLTVPAVHGEINLKALASGKHVYSEKPLASSVSEASRILNLAKKKGLMVGCAPDTFLGGALQTCRKLLDDGWIGKPVAVNAFMMSAGPESWHPDPEFLYNQGAGPMFDMGPYYLTAMVSLLGGVKKVASFSRITYPERTITSQPRFGQKIRVEEPTYVSGLMEFENGAIGNLIASFDIQGSTLPYLEIYGSQGTLLVPDPNFFSGPVKIRRAGTEEFTEAPLVFGFTQNYRGLGLAEMAQAMRGGRKNRANGEMALHILEIMNGFQESGVKGHEYLLKSKIVRPDLFPIGINENYFNLENG